MSYYPIRTQEFWRKNINSLEPMVVNRRIKKSSHAVNYTMGKQIKTIAEFDKCVKNNTLLFVSTWKRTTHPSILASMTYRTAVRFIENGFIYKAKKIEKVEP